MVGIYFNFDAPAPLWK